MNMIKLIHFTHVCKTITFVSDKKLMIINQLIHISKKPDIND